MSGDEEGIEGVEGNVRECRVTLRTGETGKVMVSGVGLMSGDMENGEND